MSNISTTDNDNNKKPRFTRNELFMHAFLLSVGLLVSIPILIALSTSLKPISEVYVYPPRLLPSSISLENYITAWNSTPFGRYLINSAIQSSIIVLFQVSFSVLAAFAFSFLKFPGRNVLFYIILGSLMIPFQLTFIPNFLLVSQWGLINTYAGLTLPFLASAFGVFLLRQFFLSIPKDLYDSAVIDGASNFRFMWQVVVPLSGGPISALAIFSFLGAWNQYLWPLIITNDANMRTVQIGIRYFLFDQERGTDWGALMAGAVIVMLPTLLLFLIAQRQLVKGIALTGLKG